MGSPRRGRDQIIPVLAVVPVVFTCMQVISGAVDVPWLDDWALAPALVKLHDGGFGFDDLWSQHSEHRLVIPRLALLALALVTGWDQRAALAMNVLVAGLTLLVLVRQARATARASGGTSSPWTPVLLATILFSFAQWQNWLWHWQLQIYLCVLAAVGGLSVLARPTLGRREVALGALLGVTATLSFAGGFAFWPAAALLVAVRHPQDRLALRPRALSWVGVSVGLAVVYLAGLKPSGPDPTLAEFSLARAIVGPLGLCGAVVSPGSTVPTDAPITLPSWLVAPAVVAIPLGAVGLLALVALTRDRLRGAPDGARRPILFWFALGAFAVGVAAMCGIGRSRSWNPMAFHPPRYVTLTELLWVAVATLLLVTTPATSPRVARASGVAAAVIGVLAMVGSLATAPLAVPWAQARAVTARGLLSGHPDALRDLVPWLDEAETAALVADVRRLQLTCFRPR